MKRISIKVVFVVLTVVSVLLLIGATFTTNWLQAMLISFAVNILTSVLVILLIEKKLNEQDQKIREREARALEKTYILNANKIIESILPVYRLEFNQLTIPVNRRIHGGVFSAIDASTFNSNFTISDLIDMLQPDITVYGTFGNTILDTYSIADRRLTDAFESMLTRCTFNYYPKLEESINTILSLSIQPNGISTILNLYRGGQQPAIQTIYGLMQNYNGNPQADYANNTYSGNLFINPLLLYLYLDSMKNALEAYCSEVKKIAEEELQ